VSEENSGEENFGPSLDPSLQLRDRDLSLAVGSRSFCHPLSGEWINFRSFSDESELTVDQKLITKVWPKIGERERERVILINQI
jgi:hypothetical protein